MNMAQMVARRPVRCRRVDLLGDVLACIAEGKLEELQSKLKLEPTRSLFKERILTNRVPKEQSPLMVAVLKNQFEIFKYILGNFRVNLEQETTAVIDGGYPVEGATPLWTASTLGRVEFVKLLVARGTDVNHSTDSKSTPLRGAAFNGHCEVCDYLVQHSADIDKPNQVGQSPLTIAAAMQKMECVKLLIEKGANVNHRGHNGDTPLHISVESGAVEIAEILVKSGASNSPNDVGFTPAILACCYGHSDVMEFLNKTFHLEPKEIYDCYCLLAAKDVLSSNNSNAWEWMKKAVAIRQEHAEAFKHLAPAASVYDGLEEPATMEDVRAILQDETKMFFISSIYCERILGKIHPTTAFYIRISGDMALAEDRYSKCIELWHRSLKFDNAARMAYELQITEDLLFAIRGFSIMADNHFIPQVEPHFQWGLKELRMAHESKISEVEVVSCLCRMIAAWLKVADCIKDSKEREEVNECISRSVKELIDIMEDNSCPLLIACLQNLPERGSGAWKDIAATHLPINRAVALLIDHSCSVHCEDENGNFPLHIAVQMKDKGALECIQTLLEYGAHADVVNFDGLTALDIAKSKGIGNQLKAAEIMSELEAAMFCNGSLQCAVSKCMSSLLSPDSAQSRDTPSSRQSVLVGVADSSQLGTPERTRELEQLKQRKTEQEEIKLVDLDSELSETGSWMHLGLHLGLTKHKLNEIHADYGIRGLKRCKLEMLSSVLDWRGDTLSWAAVVSAVSKTGNNRIAKKIADKHGVEFPITVDAVSPLSDEDTELQALKEEVQAISKKLETGETQLQACSQRKHQLEGDFMEAQKNHEFAQKYTDLLVEDRRMFQQKLEQREKQIEHLQSKQLEYERTIRGLEIQLAEVSANLEVQRKLKEKLKRFKTQKQNLFDDVESHKREIDRLREKKDELKQKLEKSRKEISDAESQLKLKNAELFEAKEQLEHLKVENDKLLEQLIKQERNTDVAIVSHGLLQSATEERSQYENLKLSRWVEEMEGIDRALLEKEAHIQQLEREEKYMNTSKTGLRTEMEGMEKEIQKLKGKVQGQHKGPLPKDISPQSVGTKSKVTPTTWNTMMHHYAEDKVDPNGSTLK